MITLYPIRFVFSSMLRFITKDEKTASLSGFFIYFKVVTNIFFRVIYVKMMITPLLFDEVLCYIFNVSIISFRYFFF